MSGAIGCMAIMSSAYLPYFGNMVFSFSAKKAFVPCQP